MLNVYLLIMKSIIPFKVPDLILFHDVENINILVTPYQTIWIVIFNLKSCQHAYHEQ